MANEINIQAALTFQRFTPALHALHWDHDPADRAVAFWTAAGSEAPRRFGFCGRPCMSSALPRQQECVVCGVPSLCEKYSEPLSSSFSSSSSSSKSLQNRGGGRERGRSEARGFSHRLYQVAHLQHRLGVAWPLVLDACLKAYTLRPSRIEPLFHVAGCYRQNEQFDPAHGQCPPVQTPTCRNSRLQASSSARRLSLPETLRPAQTRRTLPS